MYLQLASPTFYYEWGHIYFGTKITMILRPYLPLQKLYQWFLRVPKRGFINSVILPLLSRCNEHFCCPNPAQIRMGSGGMLPTNHRRAVVRIPLFWAQWACEAAVLNLLKQSRVPCRGNAILFPSLWCLLCLGPGPVSSPPARTPHLSPRLSPSL